ncbi:uncharacterized protein KY384_003227 [Bacidia gigantensis]|uniref:uncharacterized protein n=1 Tax=Bacidia gigantensis TaxID=2732470 RepID=UPI001D0537F3|nr:uncharacterized protein KY384_003227 [Bacidia gigantensis]KAG8531597.1 hypothetical protein KY384_003227 [Bacidia gigantensis]
MPPFVPSKRRASSPLRGAAPKVVKTSLSGTADSTAQKATLKANKAFVDSLNVSEDESGLSDVSSTQFEDALSPQPSKPGHQNQDDEEDDIDWENAINEEPQVDSTVVAAASAPSDNLEISFDQNNQLGSLSNPFDRKKGPNKIERQIRTSTHCMHVQLLLFHNLLRNGWACDQDVQRILVAQLPEVLQKEVRRWKAACGAKVPERQIEKSKARKGRRSAHGQRNQRDWGRPAEKQEVGVPDLSHGDPVIRLLKALVAYWRKTFTITKPSLRKQGYKPLAALEDEIAAWKKEKTDWEAYGACVENKAAFQGLARICEGDKDVGVQLFTALVRGIGLEARLVASLQPIGYGFNKDEEAATKTKRSRDTVPKGRTADQIKVDEEKEQEDPTDAQNIVRRRIKDPQKKPRKEKGSKQTPIKVSEDSEISASSSQEESEDSEPIETPRRRPNSKYDRDMPTPTYWVEVISPITHKVYPVDPMLLTPSVITSEEQLNQFEPKGAAASKAKEVMAYVVAYSADGTVKDVTTRYLKRHVWPGRTKSMRMPVAKVPVYNAKGKIKRYEEYDWFKTVMSCYERPQSKRTAADDVEEANELRPVKPIKKEAKAGEETLQGYKTSAEFVLERHLRREEALRPGAKPVKVFVSGKADKAREDPVYLREDVEICRTAESWHKEGRAIGEGQQPMKMVPVRAVTTNRRREVEEKEKVNNERLLQGIYALQQTVWIIPPPIQNGIIPKNAYNNIDCFVPSMIPKGGAHIPFRNTVRICKRMEIDYAEAVTGFEFGHRMAVPVITGVVVAKENEQAVFKQWEKEEVERKLREEAKLEKQALATWRKWLMGLRIIYRVMEEYGSNAEGHTRDEVNPFTNQKKSEKASKSKDSAGDHALQSDADPNPVVSEDQLGEEDIGGGGGGGGGGFLLADHEEDEKVAESELTVEDGSYPQHEDVTLQHRFSPQSMTSGLVTREESKNGLSVGEDIHVRKQNSVETFYDPESLTNEVNPPRHTQTNNGRRGRPPATPKTKAVTTKKGPPKRKSARLSAGGPVNDFSEDDADEGSGKRVDSNVSELTDGDTMPTRKRVGRPAATRKNARKTS